MYLSQLAAKKEYAFMSVLRREGFPVPEPVAQSRHTIVMEFIDSFPLRQIEQVADPAALYSDLMDLILRLARVGLIHGDFNEFNLLIREEVVIDPESASSSDATISLPDDAVETTLPDGSKVKLLHHSTREEQEAGTVRLVPILIDFPQMLSTTHQNAKYYFDRDVACIKRFFARRFKYESDEDGPFFEDAIKGTEKEKRLDVEVEATGFSRKMAKDLDRYIEAVGTNEAEDEGRDQDGGEEEESIQDHEEEPVEQEELEVKEEESVHGQPHDPALAQDLDNLNLEDKAFERSFYVSKEDEPSAPVQLPNHPAENAAAKKSMKKKAGWAI